MEEAENLQQWKYRDYLTGDQAICLALGEEPDGYTHDRRLASDLPEVYAYYHSIESFEMLRGSLQNAIDAKGIPSIMTGDVGDLYRETQVAVTDLIPWLEKHNIEAPFFRSKDTRKLQPAKRPEYHTHMMGIMYDVIDRYYGENYNPHDNSSVFSSEAVKKWIKDHLRSSDGEKLSDREAGAIDMLTRPDHIRKPLSKK